MANKEFPWTIYLSKAKVKLVLEHPFFASLLMNLQVIEDASVKTMGTDGKHLYISPDFVLRMGTSPNGVKKLMFVLAHEVMHCALLHMTRMNQREMRKWNIATDHAINLILKESVNEHDKESFSMPEGLLCDTQYANMTAEVIYSKLQDNDDGQQGFTACDGDGEGEDSGQGDALEGSNKGNHGKWNAKNAGQEGQDEWKQNLAQAAINAKRMGKMPGGMERYVHDVLYPKVDWRTALRNFVQPSPNDWGWNPPDRRFHDFAMPDMQGEAVQDIVIAVDTSGSIGERELKEFLSEVYGIVTAYDNFAGYICSCDAMVHTWQELDEDSMSSIQCKGGGGTSFIPVFEEIDKRGIIPAAVIYLTDGWGSFPDRSPDYPVMWIMTTDVKAPFGATVEITLNR
jgi:predicted metal-dependent peptidase